VEEHDGDVNKALLVLNKESVAPIETARGVLNFGFTAIHIKVYKGDSNSAISSAGNPAEQVLAEEGQPSGSQVADSGRPLSRPTVNKLVGEVKRGILDGNPS